MKRERRKGVLVDPDNREALAAFVKSKAGRVLTDAPLTDHARSNFREWSDPKAPPQTRMLAMAWLEENGFITDAPAPADRKRSPVLGPDGKPLASSQGKPRGKPKPRRVLVAGRLADIEEREVEWLWPGRFPVGTITFLLGVMGTGKSTFLGWLSAAVSMGRPWPDCPDENPPGTVLILQAEESLSTAVRRRFNGFGFHHDRVLVIKGTKMEGDDDDKAAWFSIGHDAQALAEECARRGDVRLIIVDPIASYLRGVSTKSDVDVREVLQPLFDLAEKYSLAVVMAAHPNKDKEKDILDRASGTGAFLQMARSAWYLSTDPNDKSRRLLSLMKENVPGTKHTAIAFTYDARTRQMWFDPKPVDMEAREVDATLQRAAREAKFTGRRGPDPTESKRASEFIFQCLESSGPCLQSTVQDLAMNQGIKEASFRKGLKKLLSEDGRVRRERNPKDGRWWIWIFVPDAPSERAPDENDPPSPPGNRAPEP